MLRPDFLEGLPDAVVKLYAQAAEDILADMARRISTYDYWIPAAEWQRQKLIEMGATQDYIFRRLNRLTGKSSAELKQLMREAGEAAVDADGAIYKAHGLSPPTIGRAKALQQVLTAGYQKTNGLFKNLTKTTAQTATQQFERALDRAYMQVTTGGMDYGAAIRSTIKDLARQGVGAVTYPSGHIDSIEVAVRRAVLTGVNQTALQLQWTLADEMDSDLVEVTAHAGARPSHAVWQGGVYSRSGKSDKYPPFAHTTGYGSGAGLGGWNCRHSFYPYFEGDQRTWTPEQLNKLDEPDYFYNGKRLTEYEATQQQRYIERQIRRWKREQACMRAADLSTDDAAAKLARWQQTQRDFLRQTGLKRQYDREQIGGVALPKKQKPVTKPVANGTIKTDKRTAQLKAIQSQHWMSQVTERDRAGLLAHFEQATDDDLALWVKYGSGIKGNLYDHATGGYYSPVENAVHLALDAVDDRSKRVGDAVNARLFFHETGHWFDHNMPICISQTPGLYDLLAADAIKHSNQVLDKKGLRQIKSFSRLSSEQKDALRSDLLDDMHLKNAVSDLYSGLTNCRVLGLYGHREDYWKRRGQAGVTSEAVAHMFESMMMKGERLDVFKEYFPQAFAKFEELIGGLTHDG